MGFFECSRESLTCKAQHPSFVVKIGGLSHFEAVFYIYIYKWTRFVFGANYAMMPRIHWNLDTCSKLDTCHFHLNALDASLTLS